MNDKGNRISSSLKSLASLRRARLRARREGVCKRSGLKILTQLADSRARFASLHRWQTRFLSAG
jgi:hypothetical protein